MDFCNKEIFNFFINIFSTYNLVKGKGSRLTIRRLRFQTPMCAYTFYVFVIAYFYMCIFKINSIKIIYISIELTMRHVPE